MMGALDLAIVHSSNVLGRTVAMAASSEFSALRLAE